MSFPRYGAYKESGVEWLGEVPDHWDVTRLNYVFEIVKRIAGTDDFDVLSITQKGIKIKDLESGEGQLASDYSKYQIVKKGDFAMNQMDLLTGYVDVSKFDGVTSPDYRVFQLFNFDRDYPQYLLRLLQNCYHQRLFFPYGQGAAHLGRWRLPKEEFNNFLFPRPPYDEQCKIAQFLDHETDRIDTLIAEQQRLIKLLKEKRQAVISHAVTKGLDPNAPMKDSSVEWLGEVPEHWEVTRAKFVSDIFVPQRNKPVLNESDGLDWVTMEDMKGKYISESSNKVSIQAIKEAGSKILRKDSVVASCVGRFGIAAINMVDVIINQQLQAFIPCQIKAEYLRELVSLSTEYFELIGTAATLIYVNQQGFENMPILSPPIDEQNQICSYVDQLNGRYEGLLNQSYESIKLLQERRSALISAAVTGKIDVRGWQAPANAPPAPILEPAHGRQ